MRFYLRGLVALALLKYSDYHGRRSLTGLRPQRALSGKCETLKSDFILCPDLAPFSAHYNKAGVFKIEKNDSQKCQDNSDYGERDFPANVDNAKHKTYGKPYGNRNKADRNYFKHGGSVWLASLA